MKDLILFVLFLAFVGCNNGSKNYPIGHLFPIIQNDKIGYIDSIGNIIIKPIFISADEFSESLAAARINGNYGYIDSTGNFAIAPRFDFATPFHQGFAIVYLNGNKFVINKKGKKGLVNNQYFYFTEKITTATAIDSFIDGVTKKYGTVLFKTTISKSNFDPKGFKFGLLKCIVDDKICYLNKKGIVVWKEEESHFSTLQNLNIDYMNTSYFYVKINPNTIMSSRNKTIDNDAFPINYANNYQKKALSIQVHPVLKDSFNKKYQGIKVFVANNTDSILYFNTIDSYLYMKVQAKDKAGKWCDIEYIQQPFCNMSNYILGLKPAHYWAFSTPIYSGDFKTKMRVELSYINPANYPISYREANNAVIYSNEYDGNINLSQFRRKQRNFSDNIRRFNLN